MSKLYEEVYKLKTIVRKGWQDLAPNAGGGRLESDAEHAFSVAILALEIMTKEKLNLDQAKVFKLIICHELGEVDFGDHTPLEDIYKRKHEKEKACVERLANECNMSNILELWTEFEEQQTPEAVFVKKIDKLDAVVQSKIYARLWKKPEVHREFKENYINIYNQFKKYI